MRLFRTLAMVIGLAAVTLLACGSGGEVAAPPEDNDGVLSGDAGETLERADAGHAPPAIQPTSEDGTPEDVLPEPDVLEPGEEVLPPGCQREVTFEAVSLGEPPPFDVVIVADHSGSIAWSQDDLAAGLSRLLDDAFGRSVRVFVLTPTQYGLSSAAAVHIATGEDLVLWRDPTTGEPFANAMTSYEQSCADGGGTAIACPADPASFGELSVTGTWSFRMPEPVAVISKEMGEAELGEQQDAVVSAILALGTNGSPDEQPVCTLNRYLLQDPEALPSNVIFILLSDEDDLSDPKHCLLSHYQDRRPLEALTHTTGCTSSCDLYRFTVERPASERKLVFSCVPVDDMGTAFPDQAEAMELFLPSADSCTEDIAECNNGDMAGAERICGLGVVQDCQKLCSESAETSLSCSINVADETLDACSTGFVQNETAYANMVDYCQQVRGGDGWSGCVREGLFVNEADGWTGSSVPQPLVESPTTLSMIRTFQSRADEVFGASGYIVETIIFDPAFTCEPQAGQSFGENLKELASSPADVFPICESYAPALARAQQFSQALLQTEYSLELASREYIEAIVVEERDGAERTLDVADYVHDADSHELHIEPSALTPRDTSLRVEVVNLCVNDAR